MKFIYKTRNLALTALFGAALAMGIPAAMAQGAVNNTVPASDDQNANTDDYQVDYNLLNKYLDYVRSEAASYQESYPEFYDDVFAPTVDAIVSKIEEMISKVEEAKATAEQGGSAYVSPVPENFYQDLTKGLQQLREDAVWAQVSLAQQEVQSLGGTLNGKVAQLQSLFEEKIASVVGEDAESFFLGEATSDAILEQLQAMETSIAKAADEAEKVDYERFVSPVTPEWVNDMNQQILDFYDGCEKLILKAEANIQSHDKDLEDVDLLQGLLTDASKEIDNKFESILGEYMGPQEKYVVTNASAFDALQAQIDEFRQDVETAASQAKADNWQTYDKSNALGGSVASFQKEINQYKEAGLNRVDKASSTLRKHDGDISITILVENKLGNQLSQVQTLYNNTLRDIIGKPCPSGEACFFYEEMFYAIQHTIDDMRYAIVAAYDEAIANNYETYNSPVGRDWRDDMDTKIDKYGEVCESRINTALENLQLHDQSVEQVSTVDVSLVDAFNAVVDNLHATLGEDLSQEDEQFFVGADTFDKIEAEIDDLRALLIQAYDKAAEDNWQSYDSKVGEGITSINEQIAKYKSDCENLADNAMHQMQLHEQDIEYINALEGMLADAANAIIEMFNSLGGQEADLSDEEISRITNEAGFDAIQEQIDALRKAMVEAAKRAEADHWQNYQQEATGVEDAIPGVAADIAAYQAEGERLVQISLGVGFEGHENNIATLSTLENKLMDAVRQAQSLYAEKLEDTIGEADEAFFYNEDEFDAIQAQIDSERVAVANAYEQAEANGKYESPITDEWVTDLEGQIQAYYDECEHRVNNAVANLQLHDEDVDMVVELEGNLMRTFEELAEEVDGNIDADILEGIRAFLIEDGYDEVAAQIDALRRAMVEQYDVAAEDNWQKYQQQVVPNTTAIDEAMAQYKEESRERTLRAMESIAAHQYDVDVIVPLDEMLGDSVAELMEEHPELFEEGSEFLVQYEELSQDVQDLWGKVKAAADAAEVDNWQSYKSVFDGVDVEALYHEVEDFFASALGDEATINLNRWDNDNNAVLQLEGELMAAIKYIQENNPNFDVDPDFDAIQAAIDSLRQRMAQAYQEADDVSWQSYECPYTESDLEEIGQMINDMIERATNTTGISGVNGDIEQPMIFTVDGKRLNAPIKGELNIFVYGNRVEKRIVK